VAESIAIPRQFRGPARSANGGYTCGLIAELVDADAVEVTLRKPPPLEVALAVERDGEGLVRVVHDGSLVAEARPAAGALEAHSAPPPSFADAELLSAEHGDDPDHPFPGCFVCGPAREPGEGLRLRPAPLGDGRVAASWRVEPQLAGFRFAWAALDCPGGWAVQPDGSRGISVLGRLSARVLAPPRAGDECVVVGWPSGSEGRKRYAGTALYRGSELLALGHAVWFELGEEARDPAAAR
jgi:hypothetical protein